MPNKLKPTYFTISAVNMLLFILLSAYLTLDWADFVYSFLSGELPDINLQIWLRSLCEIAVIVLLIAYAKPVPALNLYPAPPLNLALSVLLALFLYIPMAVFLSWINYLIVKSGIDPVINEATEAIAQSSFIEEFLFFCVLAPICEEFLFRGAIAGAYRRKIGFAAIIVSALFFGLMHAEIFSVLNGFIIGLALGYAYLKTNSMWCPVFMHMFYNLFAFTLIPDIFIINLPWTAGIFDLSLMTFEEPGYCMYQLGIAAIGILASVLIIKKLSSYNSQNKIEKSKDYKPSVCERSITGVAVMLLVVRVVQGSFGWFV